MGACQSCSSSSSRDSNAPVDPSSPAGRAARERRRSSGSADSAEGEFTELQHLLTIPFFEDLEKKHLKELREIFQRRSYDVGEVIVAEGSDESCFHIIISGCVEVTAHDEQKNPIVLHEFRKNEWFGSVALTGSQIQAITATAREPTTLLFIRSAEFESKIKQFPELQVAINVLASKPIQLQLKQIPFFAGIPELKLQLLGTLVEIRKFSAGTQICRQGQQADGLFFILQGSVEVSADATPHAAESSKIAQGGSHAFTIDSASPQRKSVDKKEIDAKAAEQRRADTENRVFLDTLHAGEYFGEISLIERCRRTATVTAIQDCITLYLSRARFDRFLNVAEEIVHNGVFDSIIRQRTANSLKSIPIFSGLKRKQIGPLTQFDEARLTLLGQLFKFENREPGDVIVREGDPASAFYIIVSGACTVSAKSPDGAEIVLAEMKSHDFFGETSLFENVRCNATVTAAEPCIMLKLKGENFREFCRIAPEVEAILQQRVGARTAARLRTIPFFSAIKENRPFSKLDLLANLMLIEEFSAGTELFREGSIGDKFYVVVSGKVEITIKTADDSLYLLDVIGENSYLGEISLVKQVPRTASARCKTDCVLVSVTSERFHKFMQIAPELTEHFNAVLNHRTANVLKTIQLFGNVKESKPFSKLDALASLFSYKVAQPDEVLYCIDEPAEFFYLLTNGSVKMVGRDGKESIIKAQSHFGAADVLRNKPRSATVTSIGTSILLVLQKDSFKSFLNVASELQPMFEEMVAERTRESQDWQNKKNEEKSFTLLKTAQETEEKEENKQETQAEAEQNEREDKQAEQGNTETAIDPNQVKLEEKERPAEEAKESKQSNETQDQENETAKQSETPENKQPSEPEKSVAEPVAQQNETEKETQIDDAKPSDQGQSEGKTEQEAEAETEEAAGDAESEATSDAGNQAAKKKNKKKKKKN